MSPNFNAPWHPLRSCWVGASYPAEFYSGIKNLKIRHSLQRIANETEEDYQNLVAVLKQAGVEVLRPPAPTGNILDWTDVNTGVISYKQAHSFTLIPRPPMQPRDSILVVGDELVATQGEAQWFGYNKESGVDDFDAPLITVVGQHLVVDRRDHVWLANWCQQRFPDRTVIPVDIGGHNDAVYCPVAPGLIVSTYHHSNYADTFPGWTVKYIENQSWNAVPEWRQLKHANVNKWWCPDSDNNPEFAEFVDTWLDNWLGYVRETVFDVNMLQLDEHTILVNNYNQDLFAWFDQYGIEPVVVPFRHRFFWDGGIHCVTSDIHRQGETDVFIAR